MEMPADIITRHVNQYDMAGANIDPIECALELDMELQSKFLFFPIEELDAIDIEHTNVLSAGTGPENCQASEGENPNWLFNHAMNAMALCRRLKENERLELEQRDIERKRQEIINRRPAPGVYTLNTGTLMNYVVAVTADRRIIDLNRTGMQTDFTDVFDGLENKSQWRFTPINTGLSA